MKFAVMKFAQGKNPLYFKFYGFLRKSELYESTVLPKVKVSKFRKQFLVTSILPKKLTKKFNFTTMIPQVKLYPFIYGEY